MSIGVEKLGGVGESTRSVGGSEQRILGNGCGMARVLDGVGFRDSAVGSGMAQGVQNADAEKQQGQQYETQDDVTRLRALAHVPPTAVPAAPSLQTPPLVLGSTAYP
ncbi:hypothetical protein [Streptomyces canus]|uniref:hypothetical protein n=1 Tax=Streptomyces canus TaxID=58343 RepID=UPI0037FE0BA7